MVTATGQQTGSELGGNFYGDRDNPQKKKQGLYGLQFIAVTLYNKRSVEYLDKILPPITKSFVDKDAKV